MLLSKIMNLINITLSPEIEQAQIGGDEKHINHGLKDTEDKHPVHFSLLETAASAQEIVHFLLFPVENLCNFHTGQILGQIGIDICGGVVHLTVHPAGKLPENHGKQYHKRHKAQYHQSQR